jgi:hypothetical protein
LHIRGAYRTKNVYAKAGNKSRTWSFFTVNKMLVYVVAAFQGIVVGWNSAAKW